jgi:hypothetical protein
MTAAVFPFPPRRQLAIRVEREGAATLVIRGPHGWLFGSRAQGLIEARELSQQDGVGIVHSFGIGDSKMAFQQKPNRGSLFKNADKSKEEDRDYAGSINIDGREYWLSGWINTTKDGNKYLSLAIKPKDEPAGQGARKPAFDDSIPFAPERR